MIRIHEVHAPMYGQPSTTFPRADMLGHHSQPPHYMAAPPPFQPAPSPIPPPPAGNLIIPDQLLLAGLEVAASGPSSSPSGCSSHGGSPCSLGSCATTQRPGFIQRSTSSHSLYKKDGYHCRFVSPWDFLGAETSPVRRVFSTGDLQHSQGSNSPLSSESSVIIESMSKACKYTPEEKRERIERYRSKRNQRNFTKKIKYACRKTLADSRPRIRGRFARNEELEKNSQIQWSNIVSGEEEEEDEDNWTHFLDAFSANYSFP
uniref:Uncharacterized protein MANES_11G137200 n=1 Tax=Rhizophora mucronata TaxID=61149 RepID=A0A2P2PIS8_RHIMU